MSDDEWIPDESSDDDEYSDEESVTVSDSESDTDDEFEEDICSKCGRTGHTDEECYARKTIDGKLIKK